MVVVTGHVETITSASASRAARRIDRDPGERQEPARHGPQGAAGRRAPKRRGEQPRRAPSCQRYASRNSHASGRGSSCERVGTVTAASGRSATMSSASVRAAETCPSPTGAVRTSTRIVGARVGTQTECRLNGRRRGRCGSCGVWRRPRWISWLCGGSMDCFGCAEAGSLAGKEAAAEERAFERAVAVHAAAAEPAASPAA